MIKELGLILSLAKGVVWTMRKGHSWEIRVHLVAGQGKHLNSEKGAWLKNWAPYWNQAKEIT